MIDFGMERDWVPRVTRGLALAVAAVWIAAGIVGAIFGVSDDTSDVVIWAVLLVGGGLAILAGVYAFATSPWPAAVLVAVGAIAGALALVWSILAPLAALVLIALAFVHARRLSGARPATV
jgi:hypothetical protein